MELLDCGMRAARRDAGCSNEVQRSAAEREAFGGDTGYLLTRKSTDTRCLQLLRAPADPVSAGPLKRPGRRKMRVAGGVGGAAISVQVRNRLEVPFWPQ